MARVVAMTRSSKPRLLLVSWHFPPDPAVGGLRWQKLTGLAAERGWGVDVVMRDVRGIRDGEDERLRELPAGTRVFHVPDHFSWIERVVDAIAFVARTALRRVGAARRGPVGTVRAGFAPATESIRRSAVRVPRTVRELSRELLSLASWSRGRRWASDARRVARPVIQPGVHRVVVSCGPPHFAHVAAARMAREHGLPLVVDLRDPWSQAQRLPEFAASVTTLWLASRDEARVVRQAQLIVANTDESRDALRNRHANHAARVIAIPNGYDDDPLPAPGRPERFTIAYAGTIYLDRDPRPLLRAVRRVVQATNAGPDAIGVEFLGDASALDGVPVAQMAAEEHVGPYVAIHPRASRREALAFLNRASMLVVLGQDSDMAIPAKAFEYMRFAAWVLVLADPGSAMGRMMTRAGADVVPPDDVATMARTIEARLREHVAGAWPVPLATNPEFSRRARARTLFRAIEAITGQPAAAAAPASQAERWFGDRSSSPQASGPSAAAAAGGVLAEYDVLHPATRGSAASS